jgi:hypothetical protein
MRYLPNLTTLLIVPIVEPLYLKNVPKSLKYHLGQFHNNYHHISHRRLALNRDRVWTKELVKKVEKAYYARVGMAYRVDVSIIEGQRASQA